MKLDRILERMFDRFGLAKKQGSWKVRKNCIECSSWNGKKCTFKNSKKVQVCEHYKKRQEVQA